jgi:hypothetical protein
VPESVADGQPSFTRVAFLCGEDMHPSAIRQRWPGARFLGIGWVNGVLSSGIGLEPDALGPRIWGILVDTGAPLEGMFVPVTRRDGTPATAVVSGEPAVVGSLAGMLAQARYWELPRDYRDRVEAAASEAMPA